MTLINTAIPINAQFTKTIGFDNTNFYISNLQFQSIEGLRDHCLTANKVASPAIPLSNLQKLTFNDGGGALKITYTKPNGKTKNFHLDGVPAQILPVVTSEVASEARLIEDKNLEKKTTDFSKSYITLVGTVIFTGGCMWIASTPRTGRRSNLVKLAQDIGPTGVAVIGGVILLITLFGMYRKSRKPATQRVFLR